MGQFKGDRAIIATPIFWHSDIVILKNFLDFLATPQDLENVKLGLKGKGLPEGSLLLFKSLKKESKFGVKQINDNWLFLEEFLEKERQPVSEIKNIEKIPKERPSDFIELVLKSIPRPYQTTGNDLNCFYQKTIQIDKLIDSFTMNKNPRQRLAKIFMELVTWAQIETQVEAQIWTQVGDQVNSQVWPHVRDQIRDQVWDQVDTQVGDQARDQARDQIKDQIKDQVGVQVWDRAIGQVDSLVKAQVEGQVKDRVGAQLKEDLQHF